MTCKEAKEESDPDPKERSRSRSRKTKRKLKRLEKRFSNLSVQGNDKRQRKMENSSKRRRKSKALEIIKETADSGEDTEIMVSDSETTKTCECAPVVHSDTDIPSLKRENAFYGVYPESNSY